jgi:hypothetical protein
LYAQIEATDPCRILDQKFCTVAKALTSWRETKVSNIRLQLAATQAIIYELDTGQETRPLTATELQRRKELKQRVLGLASLSRTMARQRAR